jgi:hypothetical protein
MYLVGWSIGLLSTHMVSFTKSTCLNAVTSCSNSLCLSGLTLCFPFELFFSFESKGTISGHKYYHYRVFKKIALVYVSEFLFSLEAQSR